MSEELLTPDLDADITPEPLPEPDGGSEIRMVPELPPPEEPDDAMREVRWRVPAGMAEGSYGWRPRGSQLR